MRYFTSHLFAATALIGLILSCRMPTTAETLVRYLAANAIIGVGVTVWFRKSRPYLAGAVAGFCFLALSIAYWWAQLWIGYFAIARGPQSQPYFEDGMIAEGLIYPFVYLAVYGPVAIAIALFASSMTIAILTSSARWLPVRAR